ncbi:hypothetical protein [Streptomyces coffeae]|uniref:Uncharacterized protein n=1 Tax=Streptomyces coffeae TaxID=621382 RepID=A0ABS1NCV5_9ACTN|nr:hypothetical protein [Streptomyces coffeae]MBL1097902.1 hypothetical protein [Streptomyces coffeae]
MAVGIPMVLPEIDLSAVGIPAPRISAADAGIHMLLSVHLKSRLKL